MCVCDECVNSGHLLLQSHDPPAASLRELEAATGSVEEHSRQISDCAVIRIVPEDNKVAMQWRQGYAKCQQRSS